MPGLYDLVSRYASPYYNIIASVFVLLIFLVAGYYGYKFYTDSQLEKKKNEDIYQPADDQNVRMYFFTADWCPHCKSAKPSIDDFDKTHNGKVINGQKLKIIRVDCTDSDEPNVAKMINTYSVKSFPTIKLVKDGSDGKEEIYEYEAKITNSNLEEFINLAM